MRFVKCTATGNLLRFDKRTQSLTPEHLREWVEARKGEGFKTFSFLLDGEDVIKPTNDPEVAVTFLRMDPSNFPSA